jgi:CDGSH-type Zn-finger protein
MENPTIAQRKPIIQKIEPGTYWWCTCGKSAGQPFCDGSHKGTSFGPEKVEITETKTVCNKPFCDGSHSGLDAD